MISHELTDNGTEQQTLLWDWNNNDIICPLVRWRHFPWWLHAVHIINSLHQREWRHHDLFLCLSKHIVKRGLLIVRRIDRRIIINYLNAHNSLNATAMVEGPATRWYILGVENKSKTESLLVSLQCFSVRAV